jgi:hypothetical protein
VKMCANILSRKIALEFNRLYQHTWKDGIGQPNTYYMSIKHISRDAILSPIRSSLP